MILAQQDWTAMQLLVLESELKAMQHLMDVTSTIVPAIIQDVLLQQVISLTLHGTVGVNRLTEEVLVRFVDQQTRLQLEPYYEQVENLRKEIREFIEDAV